jgi:Tetratricopeptide repeat
MFELFKNNGNAPPVSEETRKWIESYFQWLVHAFGEDDTKKRNILTPERANFPVRFNGEQQSAYEILRIVALQMGVDPDRVTLHFYREGQTEIYTGSPFGDRIFLQNLSGDRYTSGLYLGEDAGKYMIALEEKCLKDPHDMVAVLAHELSHILLLGEKRIEVNNEKLTDLTPMIFGIGIFSANASLKSTSGFDQRGYSKKGYLSQNEWGYALALFAHLRQEKNPQWSKYLSKDVRLALEKSLKFIYNNPEAPHKNTDQFNYELQDAAMPTSAAFVKDDPEVLIQSYKALLVGNPNDERIYNNIGYALLRQKNYSEAIEYFNKAIRVCAKYDFAYNNRGYCKLQIGQFDGALADIRKACEMNAFNAFAWRNLGAYYLAINEFSTALDYLEEAEKINDETELINFYLGKVHEKLGNLEKANEFFERSIALNEFNYSSIE